jgi:predicted DNA-binding transcriptional regulator AlpA
VLAVDQSALAAEARLLIDSVTLAEILQVKAFQLVTLRNAGRLPLPVHLGKSVRWVVQELREWAAAGQPEIGVWIKARGLSGDRVCRW